MTLPRKALKSACSLELDRRSRPHPAGSINKAYRCLLDTSAGEVAVMFERSPGVPAHFWLPSRVASTLSLPVDRTKAYPASALWAKLNSKGERLYGRHSNLRAMPELKDANLTKVTLETVQELRNILSDLGC